MPTLFDRLGGEEVISKIIRDFYAIMLEDSRINYIFKSVDIEALQRKQAWFFTSLTLEKNKGTHDYMRRAHKNLVQQHGLNSIHFDAAIECLKKAMQANKIDPQSISDTLAHAQALENFVLDR